MNNSFEEYMDSHEQCPNCRSSYIVYCSNFENVEQMSKSIVECYECNWKGISSNLRDRIIKTPKELTRHLDYPNLMIIRFKRK